MRSTLHRLDLVLRLAAPGIAPLAAQETGGEILGRIAAPSGAAIPGAAVLAVNTETSVRTSVVPVNPFPMARNSYLRATSLE